MNKKECCKYHDNNKSYNGEEAILSFLTLAYKTVFREMTDLFSLSSTSLKTLRETARDNVWDCWCETIS